MEQQNLSIVPSVYGGIGEGYNLLTKEFDDGTKNLSVLVKGAHCAACIQKIESVLQNQQEVINARLNFSTGRLSIDWNGSAVNANGYVEKIEKLGYTVRPYDVNSQKEQLDEEERFLLLCLGVAGFAMGNIMLVSVGLWTTTADTMGVVTRDFMHWISAIIALPTILFSGRPFFRSAFTALKASRTNMDVPISVGLTLAGGMSLFETINHSEHAYFDSAVMLIFFLLIGRYFDFRARKNARSAATDLLQSINGFSTLIEDDKRSSIPIRQLKQGHIILVAAGETIPVDGIILNGKSDIDVSLVTGETIPVHATSGFNVYAGTLNLSSPITIRVNKEAENSTVAGIVRLMEKAGQGQALYVRLADKVARLYTPIVHILAIAAFLGWVFAGGMAWQEALMIAITVLIITCPCALGLAVPIVQVLATGHLMKRGILVKSGDALERLATIDTILMDKTGTLTLGKPVLVNKGNDTALQIAASLAAHSRHPLSQAITQSYTGQLLTLTNVQEYPGFGLEGLLNGMTVRLGSRVWCGIPDVKNSDQIELWFDLEEREPILFLFCDELRSDSADTIRKFEMENLSTTLLSGDRSIVVKKIAQKCGITKVYSEKSPSEKFYILESLKTQGRKVLMVGDGLNDAPSLAGADVSIAPGTAIDITQNAADIIFMGEKFSPVFEAYKTARLTQKLVKQNFALAVIYNMIAIPMAAFGMVTPLVAALAMSGSSLIVIANSFRLRFSK